MANVTNIRDELLGVWKLVHSKSTSDDGKESFPLGSDAVGYIHYSETGVMAVQISRKNHGVEVKSSDYLAYFGRYEIDQQRCVIKHFLEGQLFTGQFASLEERRYELKGNQLSLRPVGHSKHEILWERA
jgi:Lipocalin-like domain